MGSKRPAIILPNGGTKDGWRKELRVRPVNGVLMGKREGINIQLMKREEAVPESEKAVVYNTGDPYMQPMLYPKNRLVEYKPIADDYTLITVNGPALSMIDFVAMHNLCRMLWEEGYVEEVPKIVAGNNVIQVKVLLSQTPDLREMMSKAYKKPFDQPLFNGQYEFSNRVDVVYTHEGRQEWEPLPDYCL